jgi:ankyrin repeat protein
MAALKGVCMTLRKLGISAVVGLLTSSCAWSSPQTPDNRLAEAVKNGDRAAVVRLLREHVPVNSAEGDGSTALHWAAYQDNVTLAELLLNAHADISAGTRIEATTPLYMACQNGSAAMISLLLAHGADPNGANSLGTTPLMVASASGSTEAVKILLDHGANPNAREHVHDQTALMFAANLDRADVIRLLATHGADLNASSRVSPVVRISFKDGTMPMLEPEDEKKAGPEKEKKSGIEDVDNGGLKSLEQDKKVADSKEPATNNHVESSKTPAADAGSGDTAEKKKPRDRGAAKMGGMTPLLYAARQGNIAAATALLDSGAKIDEISGSEQTAPLVMAIANGHFDLAKILVDHGANVNLTNAMGLAPLYATIDVQYAPHEWSAEPIVEQEKTNYLTLMQLLISRGADVNARLGKKVWSRVLTQDMSWVDPAGATAFWRATQAEDLKAMQLLRTAGADPNLPTKAGVTPLMVAAGLGWGANYSNTALGPWLPVVTYCIEQKADINAIDDLGHSALHGAAFVGNTDIVHLLVSHGAKTELKTKEGDSVADMANGPFPHSIPHPETVALLESMGSPNSHNCRSDQCVVAPKEDKKSTAEEKTKGPISAANAEKSGGGK